MNLCSIKFNSSSCASFAHTLREFAAGKHSPLLRCFLHREVLFEETNFVCLPRNELTTRGRSACVYYLAGRGRSSMANDSSTHRIRGCIQTRTNCGNHLAISDRRTPSRNAHSGRRKDKYPCRNTKAYRYLTLHYMIVFLFPPNTITINRNACLIIYSF